MTHREPVEAAARLIPALSNALGGPLLAHDPGDELAGVSYVLADRSVSVVLDAALATRLRRPTQMLCVPASAMTAHTRLGSSRRDLLQNVRSGSGGRG